MEVSLNPASTETLLKSCVCGCENGDIEVINGIDVIRCSACGLIRQIIDMSELQLAQFYEQYHEGTYTHSYGQDREVAFKRLKAYEEIPKKRVLDIGSGNGAFVEACRESGIDAIGQDIGTGGKDEYTYRNSLDKCHFPSGYADFISLHDVIEHVPHPVPFMREVMRILDDAGWLVIDFPDFYHNRGKHHWKKIEHLWYWTVPGFIKFIEDMGGKYIKAERPVDGKMTFYFQKKPIERTSILVPPGVGDIYWVLVKLRSFCERNSIELPVDIWIDAPNSKKRGLDFVRSVPFVKAAGYFTKPVYRHFGESEKSWEKRIAKAHKDKYRVMAYETDKQSIFQNLDGFDWFLSFNGTMDKGISLIDAEPDYPVNWDIPIFIDKDSERFAKEHGDYYIASFFSQGFYKKFLFQMGPKKIYETLSHIHLRTDKKIMLCGAYWDSGSDINQKLLALDKDNGYLTNMLGQTTWNQYAALLKNSAGCIGFPAGNTILGPALGVKTAIIWGPQFPESFNYNACRPTKKYKAFKTSEPHLERMEGFINHLVQENL